MKNLKKHFLTCIILSFLGLLTNSCSGKKTGKMKDLDSIRSTSNYRTKSKSVDTIVVFQEMLDKYNQDSVGLSILSMERDTTDSFLDQFIFEKSERYFLNDSNQHVFNHRFWLFKRDSNLVKNTFFNWFDQQFCQRNANVRIYSRQKLYRGNLLFICTNQSIHVVSSESKIDLERWLRFVQFTEKKVQFIYICHQVKNKPALWYTYDAKTITLIPVL